MRIREIINSFLSQFGLRLTRVSIIDNEISHFSCLRGLRERGFAPKTVLDIGAASGVWSQDCAKIFPDAYYYLIDPLIENEKSLIAVTNKIENSNYTIAAVGSYDGEVEIRVQADLDGSSILTDRDNNYHGKTRKVNLITLDSLLNNNVFSAPELIKIDVQGYELEVLKGAQKLFDKTQIFIIETSLFEFCYNMPLFHVIVNYMNKRDFLLYDIASILRRPLDGALGQIDAVFVKRSSVLRESSHWG